MTEKELSGLQRLGDAVETAISEQIEKNHETPILKGNPVQQTWYRLPIMDGITGDGSKYHIYLKKGRSDNLVIFLSGGGVAWNTFTAARPVSGGKMAAGMPNYYWNNLRPLTQVMNIHTGITEIGNSRNPFDDWNFIVIPYATGDLHVGNNVLSYEGEDGEHHILRFHGRRNFRSGLSAAKAYFPFACKLLIAGDSAGGFAVPALTSEILESYYPDCTDVTVFSDSSQLLNKSWRETAQNIWKAEDEIWSSIFTSNITVDWYAQLYRRYGDRLRYLYAGSPRDYLLSSYLNDVLNHDYTTNEEIQALFKKQMQRMLEQLKEITPNFSFFIYNWPNLRFMLGGTVHTAVRHKRFYFKTKALVSMAEWLKDAIEGNLYDVNMEDME